MPDYDSPAIPPKGVDKIHGYIAGLPPQLQGDPRRQAVPSLHGDVYQAWASIDAWLRLETADEVIYLEGAEDFDIVSPRNATTVQVKKHLDSISLGNAKAHEALENYWKLSCQESTRRIDFHYLTTSPIAMEKDACFGGLHGIEAWRVARTNCDIATKVTAYLTAKLKAKSQLRAFLQNATPTEIQERLFQRFYWLTSQPNLEVLKRSVDNRIAVLLERQRHSVNLIPNVRKYLESRFWEVVLEILPASRCLTRGDLLQQVEAATTTNLAIPIDLLPDLIGNARPGLDLLELLIQKTPKPPEPLLRRAALTTRLDELVKQRQVILLTGSVYKGKTTLAQLVASTLCPEAWWVNLTGLSYGQANIIFLALSNQIENGECPNLIIIDDLNISPTAHRVYKDSLALVLLRANATGRGVVLTAQGASSDSAIVQDFNNIQVLDVPELSTEETKALCLEHGCPEALSDIWGTFVTIWTRGHPKLVQVRLVELTTRCWPKPNQTDLTTQSPAVISVRQMAQQLLSESVPASIAEFVYLVSECSVLMHRTVAIKLAESVEGLTNAGDVLDKLTGKWIEKIEGQWFRTTALLQGVAADVWSPEKRKQAHIRLYVAIQAKQPLDPSEAAALLYHAFIAQDRARLAYTAMRLQLIAKEDTERAVERQLLWLPLVALEASQSITDDAMTGPILRRLQFQAASTLDSDFLPKICERWADDIERIPSPDAKSTMLAIMWYSIGFSQSLKVPLKPRLQAIAGIERLPDAFQELQVDRTRNFLGRDDVAASGLPANGTTVQMMFLFANRSFCNIASLDELLQWLDNVATDELRKQFDAMLEWPAVQDLGAFVQGAWTAKHEETTDWKPWLTLFERVDDYAKRRSSSRFGQEAAKASAIILSELLDRSEDALAVLDMADAAFGSSAVVLEQRANVLFHRQDDLAVLKIWKQLTSGQASKAVLDPFAYRRAGISAARLKQYGDAERIFLAAADSITPGSFDLTKFGLRIDAALVLSIGGNQPTAAKVLVEAVLTLPSKAANEGDTRWDAVQRMTVEVCRIIRKAYWKQDGEEPRIRTGDASSPVLNFPKVEPGQAARNELTRVQVLLLAATLGVGPSTITHELETLASSRYVLVRWFASQGRLSLIYSGGAESGFIRALVDYETATADLSIRQESLNPLEPDTGPRSNLKLLPERWFGLLVAGIVCSGHFLTANLTKWLDESQKELGNDAVLTNAIRLVFEGTSLPAELLEATFQDTAIPTTVRCGAAAQLLLSLPAATLTLQLQSFLVLAMISDASGTRQELFNLHVARRFAVCWHLQVENRFQFSSPRTTIPALISTVKDIEDGNGTLKLLLQAAANALDQKLGNFIEHVP